ncbi:MAG: YncE family protein [Candidatus Kapaibacteriales bacterium]
MKGFDHLKKLLLLLGFFSTFFISCRREETLYEAPSFPRYFYFVSIQKPNNIQLIELPSIKIIDDNAYFNANNEDLDTIAQIVEFRELLFILQAGSSKISIVNSRSMSKVAEIKFVNKNPIGIAFPNSTTAFVSFSNQPYLDVIDLTNYKIARTIPIPFNSGKVISIGFYVFILHPYNNSMTIVDSRTFSIVQTLSLPDLPIDIETNPSLDLVFVLNIGNGKIDTTQTKTSAKISIIPISNLTHRDDYEINIGAIKSIDVFPLGLSIPNKHYGYVATKQGLLRFYLANPSQFQKLLSGDFISINYSYKSNELIGLESKNEQTIIYFANPTSFSVTAKFIFDQKIFIFIPK